MMRIALLTTMLALATAATAAPLRDPAQPPSAVRQAAQAQNRTRPASVGATLDSEAEALLRASFDAADVAHRGTLSRDEARAGGFGWIADHFDAIDTARAGRVSFDDVRHYLKARDANAATR
jgi:hypothetical protein